LSPLFVASAPLRVQAELRAALPDVRSRLAFTRRQLRVMARAPMSPRLMAARVADALRQDFRTDGPRVRAPTLVLTGEPALDRIVPVASSREYLEAIAGSRHRVLARTGHLGIVTRPREWADLVGGFAAGV
jgi:pimeloyl-ACP methyl ester carboxylesterase